MSLPMRTLMAASAVVGGPALLAPFCGVHPTNDAALGLGGSPSGPSALHPSHAHGGQSVHRASVQASQNVKERMGRERERVHLRNALRVVWVCVRIGLDH